MSSNSEGGYRHCQSLVKGLDLLSALNRLPSGSGSISELGRQTGIHRTTLKRLLETLREEGFLSHDAATNHYRLTFRVQQLSYGFRDTVSLVEAAWPDMREVSREVVWPCSLVVPEGEEMVVRASTRLYSRLSFHPGMPGRHMPMLSTAAGRAYFAHVCDDERSVLLDMLRSRDDEQAALARDSKQVLALVRQTRAQGYGVNIGEWGVEPKFGAVAVPLRAHTGVLGSMNLTFLLRAVKGQDALLKLVAPLKAAAARIEEALAAKG
ncbi:helix-turn-helix domain-containing protein [Xenophilus arseniciresistens]|uniref:Helix-turn-helix domain-containing protein n=1 Tax=Xenophilus arseniciresistens TaxID=1283306 RepID=A0AAE3T1T1_9BURK|nr:helix-turn-helix domain-containing protein [Xenophilus arseniciresistens]MDA7417712.1 helix-turn-helix domain-containing protein [Xenophilus arseniciresistens]